MKELALALLAAAAPAPQPPTEVLTVASQRGERRVPVVTERGFPAVAAAPLAAVIDLAPATGVPGVIALRVGGRLFDFVPGAGYFRFGQQSYVLAGSPYVARDSLFLPLEFLTQMVPRLLADRYRFDPSRARLEELAQPSLVMSPPGSGTLAATRPPAAAAPARRRVVAIDAGHGGVDPGMRGPLGRSRFLAEKDVTLAIARHLARELEARGIGSVMTRTGDTLIHRSHRGRIAATAGADVFVSIHVNDADPSGRNAAAARGFETYFLGEALTEDARRVSRMEESVVRFETEITAERGDPLSFILRDLAQNEHLRESSRLAEAVQQSLGRVHPGRNRGVKQAMFTVLATSYMPAILVETGFGSNEAEARYLVSDAGQRRLARAIAEGIAGYLREYERRLN